MLGTVVRLSGAIVGLTIISGSGYYLGYESCRNNCPDCKSLSEALFEKKPEKENN